MPMKLQSVVAEQTAAGVVEGLELAAPVAAERATDKAKRTLLHSRAARLSGVITGGLLLAFTYTMIGRRRRLERIEDRLEVVTEEVVDGDD